MFWSYLSFMGIYGENTTVHGLDRLGKIALRKNVSQLRLLSPISFAFSVRPNKIVFLDEYGATVNKYLDYVEKLSKDELEEFLTHPKETFLDKVEKASTESSKEFLLSDVYIYQSEEHLPAVRKLSRPFNPAHLKAYLESYFVFLIEAFNDDGCLKNIVVLVPRYTSGKSVGELLISEKVPFPRLTVLSIKIFSPFLNEVLFFNKPLPFSNLFKAGRCYVDSIKTSFFSAFISHSPASVTCEKGVIKMSTEGGFLSANGELPGNLSFRTKNTSCDISVGLNTKSFYHPQKIQNLYNSYDELVSVDSYGSYLEAVGREVHFAISAPSSRFLDKASGHTQLLKGSFNKVGTPTFFYPEPMSLFNFFLPGYLVTRYLPRLDSAINVLRNVIARSALFGYREITTAKSKRHYAVNGFIGRSYWTYLREENKSLTHGDFSTLLRAFDDHYHYTLYFKHTINAALFSTPVYLRCGHVVSDGKLLVNNDLFSLSTNSHSGSALLEFGSRGAVVKNSLKFLFNSSYTQTTAMVRTTKMFSSLYPIKLKATYSDVKGYDPLTPIENTKSFSFKARTNALFLPVKFLLTLDRLDAVKASLFFPRTSTLLGEQILFAGSEYDTSIEGLINSLLGYSLSVGCYTTLRRKVMNGSLSLKCGLVKNRKLSPVFQLSYGFKMSAKLIKLSLCLPLTYSATQPLLRIKIK